MVAMMKSIGFKLIFILALLVVGISILHQTKIYTHLNKEIKYQATEEYKDIKPNLEVQMIYNKLKASAGTSADDINFKVNTRPVLNAYMDSNDNLVLFIGTLNFTLRDNKDPDTLAAVIGHEIGHKALGHTAVMSNCGATNLATRNCEREADRFSVFLLYNSGMDCMGASRFFQDMIQAYGIIVDPDSSHPSNLERMQATAKQCQVLKSTGVLIPVEYEKDPGPKGILDPVRSIPVY